MTKPKTGVVRILHIGRKAPKGFKELAGGIHLGKGIWLLPIEPITYKTKRGRK